MRTRHVAAADRAADRVFFEAADFPELTDFEVEARADRAYLEQLELCRERDRLAHGDDAP